MVQARRRPASVAALTILGILAAGAARGGEADPDLREVAERVLPSIVTLHVARTAEVPADLPPAIERFFSQEFRDEPPPGLEPFLRRYFREAHGSSGVGSGVIIDPRGLVATNAHVVEGAAAVTAELASGAKVPAEIVGVDPRSDVAVVRLGGRGPHRPIELAPPDSLRAGDRVVAIGSPMGFAGSVAAGVVSHPGRYLPPELDYLLAGARARGLYYGHLVQTDAMVNSGSSGGALVDARGRLVGMAVILYRSQRSEVGRMPWGMSVSVEMLRGPGFAIPVGKLRRIIPILSEGGKIEYGYLGIAPKTLSPDLAEALGMKGRRGVVVDFVEDGSPASRAGFGVGDVILSLDGRPTPHEGDIVEGVGAMGPGAEVEFRVASPGKEPRTLRATLAPRKTAPPRTGRPPTEREGAWRGVVFEDSGGEVRIASVASGSPGDRAGLVPRLRVKEIAIAGRRVAVKTAEALREELAAAAGAVALLTDKTGYLAVPAE
ncbi:MAG: trypsin-like peptidase domain-containing protein [Planctomycetota bacterium]|jgi:S1-C subfamily serine protease